MTSSTARAPSRIAERLIPTDLRLALGSAVLAATVLLWPARSRAEPGPASLVVTRGEGADDCPDAANLADQVRRLTGSAVINAAPVTSQANPSFIQVAIVRNFASYRAEIHAGGAHHGNRALEDLGPSCASLADAIAITIAIFLDPYATSGAPALPTEPARPALETPSKPAADPEPVRWPQRLTLDLAGGVAFSALAHTTPMLGGRMGWRVAERWSFSLGGAGVFSDSLEAPGGGSVDLGLSFASALGCGRALGEAEAARLDFCAGLLLGSLTGTGQGYRKRSTQHELWSAVGAGPELVMPFAPRLAWTLASLGALPLVRQGFEVETQGVRSRAFHESAAALLLTLGVRGEL